MPGEQPGHGLMRGTALLAILTTAVAVLDVVLATWAKAGTLPMSATEAGVAARAIQFVSVGGWAMLAIMFLAWVHRVVANARATHGVQASPAWAVGAWFVPFGNLLLPYVPLRRVWEAGPADSPAWLPLAWWLAWVAYLGAVLVAAFATGAAEGADAAAHAGEAGYEPQPPSWLLGAKQAVAALHVVALAFFLPWLSAMDRREAARLKASR